MPCVRPAAIVAFLAAVCALSTPASAQTGVYVQFTGQSASSSFSGSNNWFWGPTFGFYMDRHSAGPIHLGLDFRGSILKHDSAQVDSGLGGLRLTVVPHVIPFKVYGEALGGIGVQSSTTSFQYQVNGGVEYTILPRIDWRVAEIAYNGYSGANSSNPVSLSTGLVFRLP